MSSTNSVVVSGSSIINFPNFGGQHQGNTYVATATPDRVSESSFVFGKDAVVVFEFSNLTTANDSQHGFKAFDGEVSGNSRLLKITVYENAADYANGQTAYAYQPQNRDGTNLSNSSDRYGDTYLAFQTNAFASQNMPPIRSEGYTGPIPALGQELFIMPSVNLYDVLVVRKESFTYSNVTDVDYDGDGQIADLTPEKGNGFFDGGHGNRFVEETHVSPPPVCFCRGTLIATRRGEVAVEHLLVGDEVMTADHAYQPIRWIGSRQLSRDVLEEDPAFWPVRISAGALGQDLPCRDLWVSQQHRLLVRSVIAERVAHASEVLVAAKHLVNDDTIVIDTKVEEVDYFHILFDQHEIVFADGAASESLFTGPMALQSLSPEARREVLTLFPELAFGHTPPPARPLLSGKMARKLAKRHLRNDKIYVENAKAA